MNELGQGEQDRERYLNVSEVVSEALLAQYRRAMKVCQGLLLLKKDTNPKLGFCAKTPPRFGTQQPALAAILTIFVI